MIVRLVIVIFTLMLAACGTIKQNHTQDSLSETTVQDVTVAGAQMGVERVSFTVDEITVQLEAPPGWAVHTTPYGVVLTEHVRSIATEGQLDGILLHIFLDPLENVTIPVNESENLALQILSQIVADSTYVGDSSVTAPAPFLWDNHTAAYYLLCNEDENVSLVMGVVAPQSSRLVTMTVSAPMEQSSRIREILPDLMASLTVNGTRLDSTALENLPNPLHFPVP